MDAGASTLDLPDPRRYSRRAFLKYCLALTSLLALPPGAASRFAKTLGTGQRRPVIWLSFQECTGCTESLTRSYAPTFESLIFDFYSLDYHHTLQAASGEAAEAARAAVIAAGGYLLIVDGSVPLAAAGACSTIAGRTNLDILVQAAEAADLVVAVGSCAAFGGLPAAAPNPTDAHGVEQLMDRGLVPARPLVNLPGCPPMPEAIAATLAHYVVFERLPALDALHRPLAIYGNTVHDRCSRVHFFNEGLFAERFDDEGARRGWCLYRLGCKGPVTHNACATAKWNGGVSWPVDAGHPCIGCSEPGFWDLPGLYVPLAGTAGSPTPPLSPAAERGSALFNEGCVYCHDPAAGAFRTPPSQVPQAYATHGGRSHRRQLTEDEWADLVQFLEESSP
jgi:hydrogenase small subunit